MGWKHESCSKISGIISIALVILLLPCVVLGSGKNLVKEYDRKITEKSVVIDSIQQELSRGRKKVEELDKKEGSYLEQLERLEKNIDNSRTYLVRLAEQVDTIGIHVAILQDTLVVVTDALSLQQQKMKQRLRDIYKTGRPSIIEIILTSATVTNMLHRIKYFQELNQYDRKLIREIDSTKTKVLVHKEKLEKDQEELVALKTEKEVETKSLKKEKGQRRNLLKEVQAEKKAYAAMIKELEQAQRELNFLVTRLQEKRKDAKLEYERGLKIAFKKRQGKLPWPADGSVMREYGKIVHPKYKTITMSNGIDIKAIKGVKVFCVAPGQVDYIGWMRGYGKFVIVNHFGGYLTIYAHLERIDVKMDQEIKYGQPLGIVGETGSLNGSKLHFQIRQAAETLNPRKWLEKKE